MHVEVVVVVEGSVPVDAVEEVVPAVGGVVAVAVGGHGVEVLRHVIEVDDDGSNVTAASFYPGDLRSGRRRALPRRRIFPPAYSHPQRG